MGRRDGSLQLSSGKFKICHSKSQLFLNAFRTPQNALEMQRVFPRIKGCLRSPLSSPLIITPTTAIPFSPPTDWSTNKNKQQVVKILCTIILSDEEQNETFDMRQQQTSWYSFAQEYNLALMFKLVAKYTYCGLYTGLAEVWWTLQLSLQGTRLETNNLPSVHGTTRLCRQ